MTFKRQINGNKANMQFWGCVRLILTQCHWDFMICFIRAIKEAITLLMIIMLNDLKIYLIMFFITGR